MGIARPPDLDESSSDGSDHEEPMRPVFVSREQRLTIEKQRQEELAKAASEARQEALREDRKRETDQRIAEEIQREALIEEGVDLELEAIADDRDDLDPEMEKQMWKIRELKRLKRDMEKKREREEEAAELAQRRLMTDAEALREKEEREAQLPEKGQQKFLQKYYHKGAFYQDSSSELLQRDYSVPTASEDHAYDMRALPKVMQVKNFGKASQSKYTNLRDEDTSRADDPWHQLGGQRLRQMGGMHHLSKPAGQSGRRRNEEDASRGNQR